MHDAFPLIDSTYRWVPSFVLAFARISALLFMFPYFGYASVSHRVRVFFGLVLTLFVLPSIGQVDIAMDINAFQLIGLIIKEIAIGLFIGFGGLIVFEMFSLAGTLAGRQMGLAMAQILDPAHLNRSSLVGQFWSMSMMVGFIGLGFHLFLIKTIIHNFQYIPLTTGHFPSALGEIYVQTGSNVFYTAFQLAAPAIVFMMMVDTAIALMARIQPTLPIFLIVLPVKIMLGLFILTISLEIFQTLAISLMEDSKSLILGIMNQIA